MEQSHSPKEKGGSRLKRALRAIRRFIDYPGDLTSGVTPALLERWEQEEREKKIVGNEKFSATGEVDVYMDPVIGEGKLRTSLYLSLHDVDTLQKLLVGSEGRLGNWIVPLTEKNRQEIEAEIERRGSEDK